MVRRNCCDNDLSVELVDSDSGVSLGNGGAFSASSGRGFATFTRLGNLSDGCTDQIPEQIPDQEGIALKNLIRLGVGRILTFPEDRDDGSVQAVFRIGGIGNNVHAFPYGASFQGQIDGFGNLPFGDEIVVANLGNSLHNGHDIRILQEDGNNPGLIQRDNRRGLGLIHGQNPVVICISFRFFRQKAASCAQADGKGHP